MHIKIISASCEGADKLDDVTIDDTNLPAKDGTEVAFRCPKKHVKTAGKVFCQNGTLVIFPEGIKLCTTIGRQ